MKKDRTYRAYLLRFWSVMRDGSQVWFFLLEDPRTSERYGFSDLEELFDFLCEQTSQDKKELASLDWHSIQDDDSEGD